MSVMIIICDTRVNALCLDPDKLLTCRILEFVSLIFKSVKIVRNFPSHVARDVAARSSRSGFGRGVFLLTTRFRPSRRINLDTVELSERSAPLARVSFDAPMHRGSYAVRFR